MSRLRRSKKHVLFALVLSILAIVCLVFDIQYCFFAAGLTGGRVLHVGATGNLGREVFLALRKHGYTVTCLVRSTKKLRWRLTPQELEGTEVIEADVLDDGALESILRDGGFTTLVSTAGFIDRSATTDKALRKSNLHQIVRKLVAESERWLLPPRRAVFVGGAPVLQLPGIEDEALLLDQSGIPRYYGVHRLNYELLRQSKLEWTLVCPGPLVPRQAAAQELRTTLDVLPSFSSHAFRPWMTGFPLGWPLVLLRFAYRLGEFTVSYEDCAAAIAKLVESGDPSACRRVGLANPIGLRHKKTAEDAKLASQIRAWSTLSQFYP